MLHACLQQRRSIVKSLLQPLELILRIKAQQITPGSPKLLVLVNEISLHRLCQFLLKVHQFLAPFANIRNAHAPSGDVKIPTIDGLEGRGRLRESSKSPSAAKRVLSCSRRRNKSPSPNSSTFSTYNCILPSRSYNEMRPFAAIAIPSRSSGADE